MKRQQALAMETMHKIWIFGYGSLIHRPGFDFLKRRPARLQGWERRFWQGSHDHRGVPETPGRVVTLVPSASGYCDGMAYLVDPDVFDYLDHREKNGYSRRRLPLLFDTGEQVNGTVYVADKDNSAYLGPAPLPDIAQHIRHAKGPSGTNLDYLLELTTALRALGANDEHVFALEALITRHRDVPTPVKPALAQ